MEYTFGRNSKGVEILQTKGATNTDLSGRTEIKREYEDCYITDNCDVGMKYKSDKDDEGNCYDWYVITDHNRTIDFTKKLAPKIKSNSDAIDEILKII